MLECKKQLISIKNGPQYIEKVVQLPNGAWALVVFELIEKGGKTIARAVSGKLLAEQTNINFSETKGEILCLSGIKTPIEFLPIRSTFYSILDTFSRDYSFVKSQPTRAPSF